MSTSPRRPTQRVFRALAALLTVELLATIAVPVAAAAVAAGRAGPVEPSGLRAPLDPPAPLAIPAPPTPAPRAPLGLAPGSRAERVTGPGPDRRSSAARPAKPAVARPRVAPQRVSRPARVHGHNHVWSAALGLDRAVAAFPCSRTRPPAAAVYRWGCAGRNNVYLLAHAGGPFRRLHDLYVRGALRRGMRVTYADGGGRVHTYAIAWWRVVLPTRGDFAFAALARPSMTLQTCVGAGDRYRLVVRLTEVR